MTAQTYIPEPVRLDPIRAGEQDLRGVDLTGDLAPYGDTIGAITAVTVTGRDDGVGLMLGDLQVSLTPTAPFADSTNMIANFWLVSLSANFTSGTTVDYSIQIQIATSGGRLVMRDAAIMVMPERG